MKALHTMQKAAGSTKHMKRIGRGNASGKGSYSGRGIKGQRARSGGRSGLTARSMRSYLLRIPKSRGFSVAQDNFSAIVNLYDLEKFFKDGEAVTLKTLKAKGLIPHRAQRVKVLSSGSLTKKLKVRAYRFSEHAREAIIKAGGSVQADSATPDRKKRSVAAPDGGVKQG